jgi:hypothetical protein
MGSRSRNRCSSNRPTETGGERMPARLPRSPQTIPLIATCCALLVTGSVFAEPRPFRLSYQLSSEGSEIAEVEQQLESVAPNRWRFSSRVEPSGILATLVGGTISETTQLEMSGARLRPTSYRFTRRGLGRERDVTVRFDWSRGRAENEVNEERWSMRVPDDALDKHSLVLAVSADLRDGRLASSYPVADGGRLKTYTFERLGDERLVTPLGVHDTIKLRRERPGGRPATLFWHAPALDHLPVRIERRDGEGRVLRMSLVRYEPGRDGVPR